MQHPTVVVQHTLMPVHYADNDNGLSFGLTVSALNTEHLIKAFRKTPGVGLFHSEEYNQADDQPMYQNQPDLPEIYYNVSSDNNS